MLPLEERVSILTQGAKYDVSCSSSGAARANKRGYIGNAAQGGICHSFTGDGRCVSLLKILMTNNCAFDCLYCHNRRSEDIPRASLSPRELCELAIGFYRRNLIEGLFLSSAVEHSPDRTMELLLQTVTMLRREYKFNGYIHLKAIPHADRALIDAAARVADRMSMNIELPTERSLKLLAPQKTKESIIKPMHNLARTIYEYNAEGRRGVLPAGQTTQMIIGATPDADGVILRLTQNLYRMYGLKRVYYSAYSPVPNASSLLPAVHGGNLREHRLYEADWLLRFYGFSTEELLPNDGANLSADLDPKSDWALRNLDKFPVEVNTAPHEVLMRVPGIGATGAWRIVCARRHASLTHEDLRRMRIVLKRAAHFITCRGKFAGLPQKPDALRAALRTPSFARTEQLNLFGDSGLLLPGISAANEQDAPAAGVIAARGAEAALHAATGEL